MIQKIFIFLIFLVFSLGASAENPPSPEGVSPQTQSVIAFEKTQQDTFESSFIKMLLTLGGLLVLVFLTLWFFRKLSHGKLGSFGSKKIKILERKPISPKSVLYLIEIDRKQVLISESQFEVRPVLNLFETEES